MTDSRELTARSRRTAVHVVPHTHWDREWYEPFQTFRMNLVDLVDGLLPLLESDPGYAHFMLDGQMAVVDDYLAVRPHEADRLRRLVLAGRLSIGPWYILMDEFLVSGETIVRDLQLGLRRAAEFGGAMPVGYLPDMFGHIAQMPQLLQQFGFEHAVVWRGVPGRIADHPAFWWQAPDGSTIRAEYLPRGYGIGAKLPDDAKDLITQIDRFADSHPEQVTDAVLWMNGTDHLRPQPQLGRLVAEANDLQDRWGFRVSGLADFIAVATTQGLPRWGGELRSGARANLLMGVASNRSDVRQAAARAERAIERVAEPLCALHLEPERWPTALLDEAWLATIRNAAHDSICACSVDEVVDEVLVRFANATRIAEGLTERALDAIGRGVGGDHPIVVNPSARTRGGVVSLNLPASDDPLPGGVQLVRDTPSEVLMTTMPAREALAFHDVIAEQLLDICEIDVERRDDGTLDVHLHADEKRFGLLDPTPSRAAVEQLVAEQPDADVRMWWEWQATRTVLAHVAAVPGFGWRKWTPTELTVEPVQAEGRTLSNGLVTVDVADDGTFSVNGHRGLGRLVDGGDKGDTYNWCPPANDTIVDEPESARVDVVEDGPVRGKLRITASYRWPARTMGEQRFGERVVEVHTTLELHAGDDFVRVSVELDNQTRDHRLRAWFPLPEPAAKSSAECAFAVVERGLTAEGGACEEGVPTFPSRRFVSAGGLTIVHEGLVEYELVDITDDRAHALALTLLRNTGLLGQVPMRTRPLPAGPITPIEGPQMQGPQAFRYAVHIGDRDPYAVVDDAFLPLETTDPAGGPELVSDESGTPLIVTGAEVSAVIRDPSGGLTLRVFNPNPADTIVHVEGRHGWRVDLRGRPSEPFEERFELRAFGIQTLQLAES